MFTLVWSQLVVARLTSAAILAFGCPLRVLVSIIQRTVRTEIVCHLDLHLFFFPLLFDAISYFFFVYRLIFTAPTVIFFFFPHQISG